MSRSFAAPPSVAPALRAGSYYYSISQATSTTSNALGVGNLRVAPMIVYRTTALDRLGAEVSTVGEAGSKLRLGIYADDGTSRPGALVLDAGQINGDSATMQELTVAVTLTPGVYWFGAVVQTVTTTQPTVRIAANWTPSINALLGTSLPAANATAVGVMVAGVTGALPATFGTPGASATIPKTFFRVA